MMGVQEIRKLLNDLYRFKLVVLGKNGKYHLLYAPYESPYRYPWQCEAEREKFWRSKAEEYVGKMDKLTDGDILWLMMAIENEMLFPEDLPDVAPRVAEGKIRAINDKLAGQFLWSNFVRKDHITFAWRRKALFEHLTERGIVAQPEGGYYYALISEFKGGKS